MMVPRLNINGFSSDFDGPQLSRSSTCSPPSISAGSRRLRNLLLPPGSSRQVLYWYSGRGHGSKVAVPVAMVIGWTSQTSEELRFRAPSERCTLGACLEQTVTVTSRCMTWSCSW